MTTSKVYYGDARESFNAGPNLTSRILSTAIPLKLSTLFDVSGAAQLIKPNDIVAIKVHPGELLNPRYLRPDLVRIVVEKVKENGGRPFVTNSTGLGSVESVFGKTKKIVVWRWRTAAGAIDVAAAHGYTRETLGAPFVVSDGLDGVSGRRVAVKGTQLKETWVAEAFTEADKTIILSHFKGHGMSGFGGALKNIGLGAVPKQGKWMVHRYDRPSIDVAKCTGCGECLPVCIGDGITLTAGKAAINTEKCVLCDGCVIACHEGAVVFKNTSNKDGTIRMVDNVHAFIQYFGAENVFYFNFLFDIVSACDCWPLPGIPIVPDLGILASNDPVAIDKASVDLVNRSPGIPTSPAEGHGVLASGTDKFTGIYPDTDWRVQIETAEKLGLGKSNYELVKV